jgi:hypothetical protein
MFCTQVISVILRPSSTCLVVTFGKADMPDQPLPLEIGQHHERFLDRTLGRAVHAEHGAQVPPQITSATV